MKETIYKNQQYSSESIPCVSIITPVYNRTNVLPRAMRSVQKQTCKDFEYIIVDDASTDDIDSVVVPFMKMAEFPVIYIKRKIRGGGCIRQEIQLGNK